MVETIVCASDGSANCDRSPALAVRRDALLRIVPAVEKPPAGFDCDGDEAEVIARLKAHPAVVRRPGLDASRHVIRPGTGHVTELIADAAPTISADVVIADTRGRSPVFEAAPGSIRRRLLGKAGR